MSTLYRSILALIICVAIPFTGSAQTGASGLTAIPFSQVDVQSAFWTPRLDANHHVTVQHCIDWCEKTGRISNFAKAGGLMDGKFEGIYFNDSDVYKVLEGAAYELARRPNADLDATVDAIIAKMAAAQEENGYLNSYYTLVEPENKWTNLKDRHELYCAGHLFEAAVAHYQATGKRNLLDIALRFADRIDELFGPGKRHDVPGHEEIELALIKLYDATQEQKYLRLAEFFIEERGNAEHREPYGKYCQDHLPVREQSEVFGHAVRAMYYFSGVADLAMKTGDQALIAACDRIWNDLTTRKMYITGGIGVSGHGEGFAEGFDLPNEHSYAETCASIALGFFAHRLTLLRQDAHYADIFEQVLYNGLLSGVSLDGDTFFYRNPLESHGPETFDTSGGKQGTSKKHRQHWFSCACCPSNVVRFIPKVGEYLYAAADQKLYINHFMESQSKFEIGGTEISISQKTDYPWDGDIRIEIEPNQKKQIAVFIRVPNWCDNARVRVNGRDAAHTPVKGYVCIDRVWKRGDTIRLDYPMPVRRVAANPQIIENRGKVALMRGPLLYCLEEMDAAFSLWDFSLPSNAKLKPQFQRNLMNGTVVIKGKGLLSANPRQWDTALYQPVSKKKTVSFTAVPYCLWDNRKPGDMIVWLPQ
jgi:uncharacterized protein